MKGRKEWMLLKRQTNLEAGLLTGMWCFSIEKKKKGLSNRKLQQNAADCQQLSSFIAKGAQFF